MGTPRKRSYFWRWLREAWRHSWGAAEGVTGIASVALGAAVHYWPAIEAAVNDLLWQLPLWLLGGIVLFRLIMAPYWMAKADKTTTANSICLLEEQALRLSGKHAEELSGCQKERDAALRQLADAQATIHVLKNPPPPARDPNGIYQLGANVGTVHGAIRQLDRGQVRFALLDGSGEFNPDDEFQYQELRLKIIGATSISQSGSFGVAVSSKYQQAVCRIVGRE